LLDEVEEKCKVDKDRVYITGLSMGGFGTWCLAAYQSDRFAALAPICAPGAPIMVARFAHIPAWIFHGAKDTVVPVENSQQMVESLKRHGGTVKFTVYPDAGHDSWTETYKNPQLYEWLLEQKRRK